MLYNEVQQAAFLFAVCRPFRAIEDFLCSGG